MALKVDPITGEMVDDQMDPMVKDYLVKKFDLGEYGDTQRKQLQDEAKLSMGDRGIAALAALGAGISGRDAGQAGMSMLDRAQKEKRQKLDDFEKGRSNKIQEFGLDREATKAEREEQLRAERMDPNSPRSRAAQQMLIEDYGMNPDLAAKMTAEQAEARLPGLKQKLDRDMREREFSERAKDRALQREIALNQKNQAREDRLEKEAKPSEKQVKEFTEFDNALDSIKSIRAQKDSQDTGPISAAQSTVAQFFGMDDSEKSAFKSEVQDQLAQYIKSISGGAVSDSERATLMQNIPKMSDNDETFSKKLDALEARLERNRQNAVSNASKMGKNVKEFERAPNSKEETKVVNGKTYRKVPGGWELVD